MKKVSVVGKALARLYREQCEEEAKRANELRKILFEVYKEGFESALARSDKHDFDVVEEALKKIKRGTK